MIEALDIIRAAPSSELIWASPRELLNVVQAAEISCHVITVTHDLLAKLPLLGKDLDEFSLDTVRMFHATRRPRSSRSDTRLTPSERLVHDGTTRHPRIHARPFPARSPRQCTGRCGARANDRVVRGVAALSPPTTSMLDIGASDGRIAAVPASSAPSTSRASTSSGNPIPRSRCPPTTDASSPSPTRRSIS